MSTATESAPARRSSGKKGKPPKSLDADHNRRAAYLVAPTVLVLTVVIVYPLVKAVIMSFQKDAGLDKATGLFVQGGFAGFSNYRHWLLQQCQTPSGGWVKCPPGDIGSLFYPSLFVTLFFTVVTVSLEIGLGLWFATIMNRTFRGRGMVRAAILIPWAIPTAVTAKLWFFIFAYEGIANKLLHAHILWTGDTWPARFAVIIADVWKTTPFMALLILAGLQLISAEVYEASSLDGASKWQTFTKITLPMIKVPLMVAVLFRTLDVLRIFDLPYILTGGGGGSGHATTTLSILVIQQIRAGFNSASALSTIVFAIIAFVAFLFIKFGGADVVQRPPQRAKPKRAKAEEQTIDADATSGAGTGK